MRNRHSPAAAWAALVLLAPLSAAVPLAAPAQEQPADPWRLLTAENWPGKPGEMTHDHLMARVDEALLKRRAAYEKLQTAADVRAWQAERKRFFLEAIGGFPERTPLAAAITGRVERETFAVEKVLFQSEPGHYVSAALFLPRPERHAPPWPATLVLCGHAAEGKANDGYQRAAALAAHNGIAALIVDPIGQGERRQHLSDKGEGTLGGPTTEHTHVGVGSALLGRNPARFMIYDAARALDYLQSRADIRGDRLGCMGNSGGGTQTSYVMALDDRVLAAAPSCYLTSFEKLLHTIGPQDAEQNIPGQIGFGMNHADYVILRAPRPTLICAATRDFFNIEGSWDTFRQAKRAYGRLGFAERVDLIESDDTHGFKQPLREAAARFMLRWLAGRDEAVVESRFTVLSAEEIRATPRGQVMLLEGARSVFDLNRDENARLASIRRALWDGDRATALARARQVVGARPLADLPELKVEKLGEVAHAGGRVEKWLARPQADIALPALWFHPAKNTTGRLTILCDERGKSAAARAGGPVEALLAQGESVLAFDPRGVGETLATKHTWGRDSFGEEAGDALAAYLLGASHTGMRTEDMLVVARWARGAAGGLKTRLAASDGLTIAALHAAAFEPELFDEVELTRPLASWSNVLEIPQTRRQLAHVAHGALRVYDLPDLAATLGDKLRQIDPRDAAGSPLKK